MTRKSQKEFLAGTYSYTGKRYEDISIVQPGTKKLVIFCVARKESLKYVKIVV
jgi:hypothetical protein